MQFDISRPMSGENMAPPIDVLHTTLISSDTELRKIEPSAAAADDLRSAIEKTSVPISPEANGKDRLQWLKASRVCKRIADR